MRLNIQEEKLMADIKLGSVVYFPQYGTSYVTHVADDAAVNNRRNKDNYNYQGLVQLVRLDGLRPYQRQPFTQAELKEKISWLNAEIYSPDKYMLQLAVRK